MSKKADKKKKEREKRVMKQKLAAAAKRRELAKDSSDSDSGRKEGRAQKVLTGGIKQQAQVTSAKPAVVNRRTGG